MTKGLNEQQLRDIAKQLQVERHELLNQMREQVRDAEDTDRIDRYAQLQDPGDYSVADLMNDLKLDQLDREAEQLDAIENAEVRILKGDYGECEDCGTTIRPERLLAQPTASRCLQCQEKYEREHEGHISNKI